MTRAMTDASSFPAQLKRVAIYTRKSTGKGLERDFSSLDAQREACEQYVQSQASLGWALMDERYDDGGFTGASMDRPAFVRLLEDIDASRVDVVVVYKVDRLSRSLLDFAKMMDRFNQAGVAFVSVTQSFSTADAMGRLTLNILMSFAEFEREMIRERTRDKIAGARRRGKWTGGRAPFGYRAVDKKLVVERSEAEMVQALYALYLEKRSALEVARHLNEAHRIPGRPALEKEAPPLGRRWSKNAVLRALKNPLYAGFIAYDDVLYEGEHEAVVNRATFQKASAFLKTQGDGQGGAVNRDLHVLRGLLQCGVCQSAMTPASTTKKNGQRYRYYRCLSKDKRGKEACPSRPLPAPAIEAFVVERIREATADGALAEAVAARMNARVAQQRRQLHETRKTLFREVASLSAQSKRLVDALIEASGTARRLIEERLEAVGRSITAAEDRLTEIERALTALDDHVAEAEWVRSMLERFGRVWDAMSALNQGRLLRAIVRQVIVNEADGQVEIVINDLEIPGLDRAGDDAFVGAVAPQPVQENRL